MGTLSLESFFFPSAIADTINDFKNQCRIKISFTSGLSEPDFYGEIVYKFKKIMGRTDFSDQFRKIIKRYKRIGYDLNTMRQYARLVINPIMADNFTALFNCTPVDWASDSMMAQT